MARLLEKQVGAFLDHAFRLNGAVLRIAAKGGVAIFPHDGEPDAPPGRWAAFTQGNWRHVSFSETMTPCASSSGSVWLSVPTGSQHGRWRELDESRGHENTVCQCVLGFAKHINDFGLVPLRQVRLADRVEKHPLDHPMRMCGGAHKRPGCHRYVG